MKKITFFSLLFTTFGSFAQTGVQDTINMGSGYANEVFYTLSDRKKVIVPANSWHIAFETSTMSAVAFSNPASAKVYRYENGKNTDFATVDTVGLATQAELFNYVGSYDGSFNRLSTGNLDYGWGSYNMTNHHVVGDSLYIVKVGSEAIVLDIVNKAIGTFNIKFAKLNDLANPTNLSIIGSDYATKKFIFVNLITGEIVDNEDAGFDLWFRKYHDFYGQAGINTVTGVLSAPGLEVAKVNVTAGEQASHNDYNQAVYESENNVIGSDWKNVDYQTFAWTVTDTSVYYVKKSNGDIFKLFPTKFTGTSTGIAYFNISQVANASLKNIENVLFDIYPNPAKSNVTIVVDAKDDNIVINVRNQMGQLVKNESVSGQSGLSTLSLDIQNLTAGMYLIEVIQNGQSVVKPLIKQ